MISSCMRLAGATVVSTKNSNGVFWAKEKLHWNSKQYNLHFLFWIIPLFSYHWYIILIELKKERTQKTSVDIKWKHYSGCNAMKIYQRVFFLSKTTTCGTTLLARKKENECWIKPLTHVNKIFLFISLLCMILLANKIWTFANS